MDILKLSKFLVVAFSLLSCFDDHDKEDENKELGCFE